MGITLKAENVSIRYITGDFKDIGLKEYTMRKLTGKYHVQEFMAVDGVSFELHEGDMLGIVGANGAGKSTLLKAVAGIMEPTCGKITATGEIAALLELGSGFDGDLTVKENAYLRGAMLGYTREFMDRTYEQIIDFAELRPFGDRPFKQLSSGMKSRLAFSIASLVNPDILILDEVLSVGDGAFQEKSAQKMREIISQGATTILVSHSLQQIRELCNKVLWLDHGRQVAFGETQEICDRYEAFLKGGELPSVQIQMQEQAGETEATEAQLGENARAEEPSRSARPFFLKRLAASLTLALFCALLAACIGQQWFSDVQDRQDSQIKIRAQEGSGAVTFRGALVDGQWVSPRDHVPDGGGWNYDSEQAVYTATDARPMTFQLPAGTERTLVFTAGPDEGIAMVVADGSALTFDLWNENFVELGLQYALEGKSPSNSKYIFAIGTVTFLLILTVCLMRTKKESMVQIAVRMVGARPGRAEGAGSGRFRKSSWRFFLRRVAVSLTLALFCALLAAYIGQQGFSEVQDRQDSQVVICAQEGSGSVTFRGALVDGQWVSPRDHVPDGGGWSYNPEEAVYTASNAQPLTFLLPAGTERTLVFTAGPKEGVVEVEVDGQVIAFDLWDQNFVETGHQYAVGESRPDLTYITIGVVVFCLMFILCLTGILPNYDDRWKDAMIQKGIKGVAKDLAPAYVLLFVSCFMLFIFEPVLMYATNMIDFWFDFQIMIGPVLTIFARFFLAGIVLIFAIYNADLLLSKRLLLYKGIILAGFTIFFLLYLQGNWLAGNLPGLTGEEIVWENYGKFENFVLIFAAVILTAALILSLKKRGLNRTVFYTAVCASTIFVMLFASLISTVLANKALEQKDTFTPTMENYNTISSGKNFLIFLVDTVDSQVCYDVMMGDDDFRGMMEDFTYYPDTLSVYSRTRDSIPSILTGIVYRNQMGYVDFFSNAYNQSPLFEKLTQNDYAINIYSSQVLWNGERSYDIENSASIYDISLDSNDFLGQELKYVKFKYLPYGLKQLSEIETLDFSIGKIMDSEYDRFYWGNKENYNNITTNKVLNKQSQNYFQFVHCEGSHPPFDMDKNLNPIEGGVFKQKVPASLTMIKAYLQRLKDNDVYDNSAIIIMADHGYESEKFEEPYLELERVNPILFIKGFNEKHEMLESDRSVSYMDLQDAFCDLIDGKQSTELFADLEPGRTRTIIWEAWPKEYHKVEYETTGKAWEIYKFTPTGNVYDLEG